MSQVEGETTNLQLYNHNNTRDQEQTSTVKTLVMLIVRIVPIWDFTHWKSLKNIQQKIGKTYLLH